MSQSASSFTLEFSSQGAPALLLEELAWQVFRFTGCTAVPTDALRAALAKATADGAFGGSRRCDVQLRANSHTLEILVSANGGRIWQMSCAIL